MDDWLYKQLTECWCLLAGVAVEFKSHMRVDAFSLINVFGISDDKYYIDDSCCGTSSVAFRTAPLIGGLSCFKLSTRSLLLVLLHVKMLFDDIDEYATKNRQRKQSHIAPSGVTCSLCLRNTCMSRKLV